MNIFVKVRGLNGHSGVFRGDECPFEVRGMALIRVGPAIIAVMR